MGEEGPGADQRSRRSARRGGSAAGPPRRRGARPDALRARDRFLLGGDGDHPLHHRRLRWRVLPGAADARRDRRGRGGCADPAALDRPAAARLRSASLAAVCASRRRDLQRDRSRQPPAHRRHRERLRLSLLPDLVRYRDPLSRAADGGDRYRVPAPGRLSGRRHRGPRAARREALRLQPHAAGRLRADHLHRQPGGHEPVPARGQASHRPGEGERAAAGARPAEERVFRQCQPRAAHSPHAHPGSRLLAHARVAWPVGNGTAHARGDHPPQRDALAAADQRPAAARQARVRGTAHRSRARRRGGFGAAHLRRGAGVRRVAGSATRAGDRERRPIHLERGRAAPRPHRAQLDLERLQVLSAVPRIVVPVAAPTSSAPELPKVRLEPALPGQVEPAGIVGARLAVVEDNPELLAYLTQELGRWYRVVPYVDSTEAVQAIDADPPDLIVSDIMMPGLDGIALARKIRGQPRTAEVPVILLSAREEVESKIAGFEAGADDYVHKPFDLQELRARIELHLRLRTQAQKLREALEQLKKAEASLVQSEKMVALGRMIAGVAHELNNPIHFLRGNLALLRRHISSVGSTAPLMADIDESVERLTAVTRQLLLFGRKQSGDVNAAVKLADVVPLAVKMVAPQTPKGVRIVQEIDGEVVRANPQDLFQVILNIVHNALQAVDPQHGEVRIAASRNGDRVELSVIDNGCGITKENLSRIFDPFFTTKPPGSGTGLGLSIVQELVAAQKGTVRVESEIGRGTRVAVSLQAVLP